MFSIGREVLMKALSGIGKVVHDKEAIPVLSSVRIRAANGKVTVSATNLEEYLDYEFRDNQNMRSMDFIVGFKDLKAICDQTEGSIVFQYAGDRIEVVTESADQRKVRALETGNLADWPKEPVLVEHVAPVSKAVYSWIRALLPYAAGAKDSRRYLDSVYLEKNGMTATDGKELAHVEWKLPVDDLIVPTTKVLASKLFEYNGFLGTASNKDVKYLCIKHEGFSYLVKCRPEKYPNYKQVVPKPSDLRMKLELPANSVRELLKYVAAMPARGENLSVVLYAGGHGVHVFSDEEKPSVISTDGIAGTQEDCFVRFNRHLLIKALNLNFSEVVPTSVHISFGDDHPVVVRGIGSAYSVFMPIRGNGFNKEKFLSLIKDRANPAKEEPVKTRTETAPQAATATAPVPRPEEQRPAFNVVRPTDPNEVFDEAAEAIDNLKASIKGIYDGAADLQRKLKDAQKALKNKEREYQSTKQLITKLRTASGF